MAGCSADDETTDAGLADHTGGEAETEGGEASGGEESGGEESGSETSGDGETGGTLAPSECEDVAALFLTLGSANPDLPDPFVSASCSDTEITVTSNSIPDFPYVGTSPGVPTEVEMTYAFPTTPTVAETPGEIPIVGPIGVAVNGLPIYGPTEGPGGDVQARPGGFAECGGHNGPTTYHYHLFLVTGSDRCRFSAADGRVVYGYAFDGYPIYGGYDYTSSYELTDESLFDTDTWSAHTYIEGSGDLDECNGRVDADGNYGYYATEGFPYLLGCFRGELE